MPNMVSRKHTDKSQKYFYTSSDNMRHDENNFDFLRFLAANLVIVRHSVPLTGNGISYAVKLTNHQTSLGAICVEIFFIISGYLISSSYIRLNNIFKYLLFRVLRIFPALVVVILITVFIVGPIVSRVPINIYFTSATTFHYLKCILLYPMQYNLTGFNTHAVTEYNTAVNGSLWTLSLEFTCYLFIGILGFCKVLNKYTTFFIAGISLFLFVNFTTIFHPSENVFLYQKIWAISNFLDILLIEFFRLTCYFFMGSFVYFIKDTIVYNWKWLLFSFIIVFLSCKAASGLNIALPLFGTYILFYLAFSKKIKLQNFGKYGDFSYGIYIYGFLIQQLLIMAYHGKMSNTLNYLIALPIAVGMGVFSYHLVEKPCMKLKKYF